MWRGDFIVSGSQMRTPETLDGEKFARLCRSTAEWDTWAGKVIRKSAGGTNTHLAAKQHFLKVPESSAELWQDSETKVQEQSADK